MSPEFIHEIRKLISKNELENAIEKLKVGNEWMPETAKEEILLLSGQLRKLRQQEIRGVISHENSSLEINKIRNSLLEVINLYSKSPKEQAKITLRKRMQWVIPLGVFLTLTSGMFWWIFQPQPNFKIQADLLVDRVSFRYYEGPTDFIRGKIQSCYWQNFKTIDIEGNQVIVGGNTNQQKIQTSSNIIIKSDENIAGIGVRFGITVLEQLYLETGALLTLTHIENLSSAIKITIQQPSELKSYWTYHDSIDMEIEMVNVQGIPNLEAIYAPEKIRIFPPENKAREIKINSFSGTSHLELEFSENFEIVGNNLLIKELSFYQPQESIAIPTILSGEISIGSLDKEPLKIIHLSDREALDIYSNHSFVLQKMTFTKEGIAIKFSGEVQKIETGRNHESRNPIRIEWLWNEQKMMVIASIFVLLVFVTFGFIRIKK